MSFTNEAVISGGLATYTWTNLKPGTYLHQSGTHPAVQVQMGLYGAVKHDFAVRQAYNDASSVVYQNEVILLFSAIDPVIHAHVAGGTYGTPPPVGITSTIDYDAKYFLINGEPYPALKPIPAGDPGQTAIIRFLNAGLETYVPLLQGLYMKLIAEDGNLFPYPKQQYSVLPPAGKTMDATISPTSAMILHVYDRRMNLTNTASSPGGMLRFLQIGAVYSSTIGVYNPTTSTFSLRNSNTTGVPDIAFTYGISGDIPLVGAWDGLP